MKLSGIQNLQLEKHEVPVDAEEVDDFPIMVVRNHVQIWISEVQMDPGSIGVEDHLIHEIWEISNNLTVLDQMDRQGISVQDILTIDQVRGYKIMDLRVLL